MVLLRYYASGIHIAYNWLIVLGLDRSEPCSVAVVASVDSSSATASFEASARCQATC